ncbi:MAG: hypothetical protein ABJC12_02155 [Saprospiraceae bacterium]
MKKYISSALVLFIILSVTGEIAASDKVLPTEWVSIVNDRTLYITGEEIHFSARVFMEENAGIPSSSILYVELISPQGQSFVSNKYSILNSGAHGYLSIPEDLITGIYYLKAYTKYMRNFGPDDYVYVPLKIINPKVDDVLGGKDLTPYKETFQTDHTLNGFFTITTDVNEYSARQDVLVNVDLDQAGQKEWLNVSVAVVPESANQVFALPVYHHTSSIPEYYPDTRGISLTGKLKDIRTRREIAGTRINLSIIGKGRDFMATETDSTGRYFFSLPVYSGYRDIFLGVEKEDTSHFQLLIDNDFCSLPVHLPSPAFTLSDEERRTAYTMALNRQINAQFNVDTMECPNEFEADEKAFYGTPSEIINLDNYIALPTLEEYFNELPGAVNVRKKNGHKYFKVLGTQPEMSYYKPLVLVDYVAVNNPEKILAATPASISRIEVVRLPYIKGDITYGGIVSIISKKGDFGGIDLPSSGIFLDYHFLSDSCHCNIPPEQSPNEPDARNTLYWNPDLQLGKNEAATFSFSTPDVPGKYRIWVKGIDSSGNVEMQSKAIVVRKQTD